MNLITISLPTQAKPVNAGTLAPRVANWLPKLDGILFSALPIQGHKVQYLLVTWGRLKIFFLF